MNEKINEHFFVLVFSRVCFFTVMYVVFACNRFL